MPVEYGEPLSPRELEMVDLVAEGLTNREIAARAFLSPNTVKVHLRNIFAKTGVASRTELTVLAVQEGWVIVPGVHTAPPPVANAPAAPETEAVTPVATEVAAPSLKTAVSTPTAPRADSAPLPPASPPWPRERWWGLLLAGVVAVFIMTLPQRPHNPTAASLDSNIFDPAQSPLDPLILTEDDGWEELAPLPVRRAGLGLALHAGTLYGIGGMTSAGPVADLSIYDVALRVWRVGSPRPVALANVGAGLVQNVLVVPGGCDAAWQPQSVTHIYDIQQDVWREAAPLPQPLCAYALTVFEDEVYVFGGLGSQGDYRAETYVYNVAEDTWTARAASPEARAFGAAATLNKRIFYVGGHDGRRERATCEIYSPKEERWQSCVPMLQPRSGLGLVSLGGQLQAIGGGWDAYLGFNERYDPANEMWRVLETPIIGEWRNLGAVAWDGALYVVGGWNGDYMNRMYKFELLRHRVYITTMFATEKDE